MMKILIVEDDENTAKYIQTCLSIGHYQAEVCNNGAAAVELLSKENFDLILLDIMLPAMDGFEVQEKIKTKNIPIIFLTAMQDISDKVRGLRAGAEDYIVKPFEVMELLARIEVVLRRCHKTDTSLVYDTIKIDMEKHTITMDGEPVLISPKEFEVFRSRKRSHTFEKPCSNYTTAANRPNKRRIFSIFLCNGRSDIRSM